MVMGGGLFGTYPEVQPLLSPVGQDWQFWAVLRAKIGRCSGPR